MGIMQYEQCESRRSQALNYQPLFGNWARANKNNKKNFINKQITLQKHYPRIAGLFEAGQCVQNMKLRWRLAKESLEFTNKRNKSRNMDED